jgi:hypothetical protein
MKKKNYKNTRKELYRSVPLYQKMICAYELMGLSPDIYLNLIKTYKAQLKELLHLKPLKIVEEIKRQGLNKV